MRIATPIVTTLAAIMLSIFAYSFGPGSFFDDAAVIGVPLWTVCGLLAVALAVVTADQVRRVRRR